MCHFLFNVYKCDLFLCIFQPVILKELNTDGDFTEDQRIELNTVRCPCGLDAVTLLFYLMWHDILFVKYYAIYSTVFI